jgi:hypothetical protein
MKKLNAHHYDTCTSDYFSGHHAPHLQIPVYKGMTLKEIKQSLLDELNIGYIGGSFDYELRENEAFHARIKAAINRIRAQSRQRKFFMDLEETDDDDYTVYAFFVFLDDNQRFDEEDFQS